MRYNPRPWLAAALVAVTLALVVFAFYEAGPLLVVEDPLQKARAVVVFGGGIPFRAMEAAKLYREGWAPEVWLSDDTLNTGRRASNLQPEPVKTGRDSR